MRHFVRNLFLASGLLVTALTPAMAEGLLSGGATGSGSMSSGVNVGTGTGATLGGGAGTSTDGSLMDDSTVTDQPATTTTSGADAAGNKMGVSQRLKPGMGIRSQNGLDASAKVKTPIVTTGARTGVVTHSSATY